MSKILKLLETLARRSPVGTLLLGQKKRSFEVFVEEKLLYLVGDEFLEKVDIASLIDTGLLGRKLAITALETTIISTNLKQTILPEALHSRGLIDKNEFQQLAERHFQEELFARLTRYPESFYFQEDYVPDSIIGRNSVALQHPLPIEPFLEVLLKRLEHMSLIRALIPSQREVFVISEKGMARKQRGGSDFGLQRIFDLIDGFRDLRSIIDDGYLYPYYVERRIVEGLQEGFIKKTVMPELKNVNPSLLSATDAAAYIPLYKNAIKYGADELVAREGYAKLLIHLEEKEEAAKQYNFIGDTCYQMGRRNRAIRAYVDGLTLTPEDTTIAEKILQICHQEAAQKLHRGKKSEAIDVYRNALTIQPDNVRTFHALINLYASTKDVENLAELCDFAGSRSRIKQDPALAIEVLEKVISRFPKNPLFYKKLINLYFDFRMTQQGLHHMERLARLYLKSGKREHGARLVDKILRLDPGRKHLWAYSSKPPPQARKETRAYWTQVLLRTGLLSLLAFLLYQSWTYIKLQPVRDHSYLAFADSKWLEPSRRHSLHHSNLELQLQTLAQLAEDFEEKYPFSVFRLEANKLRKEFTRSADRLKAETMKRKEDLLRKGLQFLDEGKYQLGSSYLNQLLDCPRSDPIRRKATQALRRNRKYEEEALALFHKAEKKRTAGRWPETYKILNTILKHYSVSNVAKRVVLPVEVETVPAGATARSTGGRSFKTPCVFNIAPRKHQEITFELPGFESVALTLKATDGPRKLVPLSQKPTLTLKEPAFEKYSPVFKDNYLFGVSTTGDLYSVHRKTGHLSLHHQTAELIHPISAPKDWGSYLIIALNNGHILTIDPRTKQKKPYKSNGLLTTALVVMQKSSTVSFGTSRSLLVELNPEVPQVVAKIRLDNPAERLVSCGVGGVIGLDRGNHVFRADFRSRKVLWKTPVAKKVVAGPLLSGDLERGKVFVLTEDNLLSRINPTDGRILSKKSLPGKSPRVAFLYDSKRLLIFEKPDSILEVSLRPGEEFHNKKHTDDVFLGGFDRLEELDAGLAFFREDGSFHLLDATTLRPKWSYRPRQEPIVAATSDSETVVLIDNAGTLRVFPLPLGL